MAKPNYSFQKRQKELERKKKKEEKLQRKREGSAAAVDEAGETPGEGDGDEAPAGEDNACVTA